MNLISTWPSAPIAICARSPPWMNTLAMTGPATRRPCPGTVTSGSIFCKERGRCDDQTSPTFPPCANHCDDAPASKADKQGAIKKRPTHRADRSGEGKAAKTWSMPARTATSGGTMNCNCRRPGLRRSPVSTRLATDRRASIVHSGACARFSLENREGAAANGARRKSRTVISRR